MSKFRLHIDIPMHFEEESAIKDTERVVGMLNDHFNELRKMGVSTVNYRLGHDDDRQKSNYLDKNENGHVSNKKSVIPL